jgi:hypothetical protein
MRAGRREFPDLHYVAVSGPRQTSEPATAFFCYFFACLASFAGQNLVLGQIDIRIDPWDWSLPLGRDLTWRLIVVCHTVHDP